MTAPVMPDDPLEFWRFLRENNPQEAATFERFLLETGRVDPLILDREKRQEEFRTGRMGRRIARENLNEAEALDAERAMEEQATGLRGAGVRGLGALAALSRDVPGVEAVQAGARSLVQGQPYAEALSDIRTAEQEVNPVSRIGLRLAGGGSAMAALPAKIPGVPFGKAVTQGATYGGLLAALNAEPDQSVGERSLKATGAALLGGAVGKVADVLGTVIRSKLNPGYEELAARLAQRRANAVDPLYAQATQEGMQNITTPITPRMQALFEEPMVKRIVTALRENPEFRSMELNDPRFLKEISQALTDVQRRASSSMAQDNMADVVARNAGAIKQQFAEAVSGPTGPMPTLALANQEYAAQSALGDAMARGADAMSLGARSGNAISSLEALAERGPRSLLEYLKKASPEAAEYAVKGAEAAIQRPLASGGVVGMANPLRTVQRASTLWGGDLLRQIDAFRAPSSGRSLVELLRNSAVAGSTPNLGGFR